ncbi:LOW QUALITY PROTEIN: uncharacterized protein LOC108111081 [Drosophila eugracilis]|uniref:LOW QUALITY PROTEIN: uncharacterized protein LOC108111081 n=1 Tax=Drosophila eugracilis TaxID=29029 RepID=UPI001BD9BC75|nr:LOW QUALITY PROTEIN: uncharacterized protein LOC108111081 [Drosophila eugracilis]
MERSYRQKREWLKNNGASNGNSNNAGKNGDNRRYTAYSDQSGRNLGGWASSSWSSSNITNFLPSSPSDYASADPAPQVASIWSRKRTNWDNNQDLTERITNMNNQSWSGNRGSANLDQWRGPKLQPILTMAEENGLPNRIRGDFLGLSGAKRKLFYRYREMGCSDEEALAKTLENSMDSVNFTGGARKWYDKYVASGCTKEEAIANMLQYKKNLAIKRAALAAGNRGRKRPIDNSSLGGRSKEEPKTRRMRTERPPKTSAVKNKGFSMAIVSDNYPISILSKKELVKVESGLVEEMKKGWKTSINFGGIRFLPGLISVICLDYNSRQWLEEVVPKMSIIPGIKLMACPENEISAAKVITILVPRCADETDNVTIDLLKDQNTDLLSKTWKFGRIIKSRDGKIVSISIGEKSLELLKKKGGTVSYRFNQLPYRIVNGKGALMTIRENELDTPKKKIAESTEIDLTEEDGEEYISSLELTIVDEVKGDDDEEIEMFEVKSEVEIAEKNNDNEEEEAKEMITEKEITEEEIAQEEIVEESQGADESAEDEHQQKEDKIVENEETTNTE